MTTSNHHHPHPHHGSSKHPHHHTTSYYTLIVLGICTLTLVTFQFIVASLDHHQEQHHQQQQQQQPPAQKVSTTTTTKNANVIPSKQEYFQTSSEPNKQKINQQLRTNQQQQKQRQASSSSSSSSSSPPPPHYHVVFSTSCSDQQHWESWVFFYHAYRVQQPGNITRIVSGCSDSEQTALQQFHDAYIVPSFGTNYHVHFTPDYSTLALAEGKHSYKYMNKPYGLRHWFEHGPLQFKHHNHDDFQSTVPDKSVLDGIVLLLDPDMILLRPLRHDFTNEEVMFVTKNNKNDGILTKVVQHGYPMSQQDGYLNNEWMKIDWATIFNHTNNTYIRPPVWDDGPIYWNTGPPYLATVQDMYRIVRLWSFLTPKVLAVHPKLFAEMFGYILATVQLQLPHQMIRSIVTSTTTTNSREGWPYIDALPDDDDGDALCQVANQAVSVQPRIDNSSSSSTTTFASPSAKLPIGLHYCKRYMLGKHFWSKYRIKKNIMDCDKPLLQPVTTLKGLYPHPQDEYYMITPPRADGKDANEWSEEKNRKSIKRNQAKREAFMLCGMFTAVNEALRFLKTKTTACQGGNSTTTAPNLKETYTVYNDPTNYR